MTRSGAPGGSGAPRRSRAHRRLAAGVAVLLVVGAVGCSTGSSSGSAAGIDAQFVAQVHQQAPDISRYKTDSELIRLGGAACDGFRSGASTVQVADRLELAETSPLLPAQDFGAVLSAAVAVLCPQFHSRLSPLSTPG